jgi:hypothetical protein
MIRITWKESINICFIMIDIRGIARIFVKGVSSQSLQEGFAAPLAGSFSQIWSISDTV